MCWSSHRHNHVEDSYYRRREAGWRPENDPVSTPGNVRVSDAERDHVVEVLKRHTADGRLTLDEFAARVEEALSARTGSELRTTLRELPALEIARPPRSSPTPNPMGRLALIAIVGAFLWLAVMQFAVWPLIIIAVFGLCGLGGRCASVRVE